jgi:ketosteroid isomerase-like protein
MTDASVLDELDRDIWHPFRRTYRDRDLPGYLCLYDRDLIRAGGPTKEIYGYDRLAADTADWFAQAAGRGDTFEIEFRFTERIADHEHASERGYYRITATFADSSTRELYGRFHTFARKSGGRWRIVVDYDTDDGGTITAEMYSEMARAG